MLIESVANIPTGATKQSGRVILAHGEVTGHAHEIDIDSADLWKHAEAVFVRVKRPTQLRHQEHAPIKVGVGALRVTRQREYSPEAIRNVAD